jgi:translocator protein
MAPQQHRHRRRQSGRFTIAIAAATLVVVLACGCGGGTTTTRTADAFSTTTFASTSSFLSPQRRRRRRRKEDYRKEGSTKLVVPHFDPLHAVMVDPAILTAGLVITHVVGGALPTPIVVNAIKSWYRQINLPKWTPPDRLFAPVWPCLYASMGFAVARVINSSTKSMIPWYKTTSLQLWTIHFLLNVSWAPIFFGWKNFRLAAATNFALLTTLAGTIYFWWNGGHITSCLLLLPYALWLSFATILNLAICRSNPGPYNNARFVVDLKKLQRNAAVYAGIQPTAGAKK